MRALVEQSRKILNGDMDGMSPASREDDIWGSFAKVHAMSVNGKQSGICDDDLKCVADRFGIGNHAEIIAFVRAQTANRAS